MALRPYIVGNWKMNGLRGALAEARAIDRMAQRHPGSRSPGAARHAACRPWR
jgi:hypothetical protein